MKPTLSANDKRALTELLLRGVSAIGMPQAVTPESIGEILRAGFEAQDKFVRELIENRTDRAKKFREALTATVYVGALGQGIAEKLVDKWDRETRDADFVAARSLLESRR